MNRAECLRLLASNTFGRLSVNIGRGAPAIRPVNYVFDERSQSIVFQSDPGSKLFGLVTSGRAAFEIDGVDETTQTGWSVIAAGRAEEITNPFERRRLERLAAAPWAPGPKSHWLRIRINLVTGRRIDAPRPAAIDT